MDKLLTAQEVADLLGVPISTVYGWNHRKTGPRGMHVGKHLRYFEADLLAWLDTRATAMAAA